MSLLLKPKQFSRYHFIKCCMEKVRECWIVLRESSLHTSHLCLQPRDHTEYGLGWNFQMVYGYIRNGVGVFTAICRAADWERRHGSRTAISHWSWKQNTQYLHIIHISTFHFFNNHFLFLKIRHTICFLLTTEHSSVSILADILTFHYICGLWKLPEGNPKINR